MNLGTKIKKWRKDKSFTLDQAAKILKMNRMSVWKIEQGRFLVDNLRFHTIKRIAKELNVTIDSLCAMK